MLDKSLNFLRPYEIKDLIRIGRNEDGGYIVPKEILNKSNFLLSFGMGSHWNFEEDFLKYSIKNKVHIYDHTVDLFFFIYRIYKSIKRIFYFKSSIKNVVYKYNELINFLKINKKRFIHYKEKVDIKKNQFCTDLITIFSRISEKKLILKIDIEGDEYKILKNILNFLDKIELLIIEFHEIDIKREKFVMIIKEIQNNYNIIHLHGNNATGYCDDGLPRTIEITFLKKNIDKILPLKKINKFPINGLDFPNLPYVQDLEINFNK